MGVALAALQQVSDESEEGICVCVAEVCECV